MLCRLRVIVCYVFVTNLTSTERVYVMKQTTRVLLAVVMSFLLLSFIYTSTYNCYRSSQEHEKAKLPLLLPEDISELSENDVILHGNLNGNVRLNPRQQDIVHKSHGHRYAISSSYWEQQTNAIINMFCMQRWAHSVGLTVVEPFACQSELKFPYELLHNASLSNTLMLHDYIDIDYWNERTSEWGVPPLETWENFIKHSTKKITVVVMSHFGAGGTYINDEIQSHPNCLKWKRWFFETHAKLFRVLHFEAVRVVCFTFFEHIMTPETFNAGLQVEGEEDITVWFTEWRGVENGRISFVGFGNNEFGRTQGGQDNLLTMIRSSKRLLSDSKKYVHQVLGVEFDQYDAVVIRVKPKNGYTVEDNVEHYSKCAEVLEDHLKAVTHNSTDHHKSFLAIDMGKFGDMVRGDTFDYDSKGKYTGNGIKLFQRFLNMVYGSKSISSYDDDFVQATNGVMDSGYIGAVQKTIAMNARSLVVVGGHSNFQKIIIQNLSKRHEDSIKLICYGSYT